MVAGWNMFLNERDISALAGVKTTWIWWGPPMWWGIPTGLLFLLLLVGQGIWLLKLYLANRKRNLFLRETVTAFLEGSNLTRETIPLTSGGDHTSVSKQVFSVGYDKSYRHMSQVSLNMYVTVAKYTILTTVQRG